MEWQPINTQQDICNIQNLYGDFLDAEIVNFNFESGNYVDSKLTGHEHMKNEFHILFQRMDIDPFSIEVVFEETRRVNFYAPLINESSASISYAKFVKNKEYIYWTKWKNFDPYNAEHLKQDVTFIEAKRAKWRIVS